MKLTTLPLAVLASVTILTGCEDKTSVEWYMAHHDDMLKKYEECYISRTWEAEDCFHAKTAFHRVKMNPDVARGYNELIIRADKLRKSAPIPDLN